MQFAVCLSFTDQRPEVDLLTGEVATDVRSSGLSAADSAALELALQVAVAWGAEVVAVTAGPPEAEAVLRDALAVGAARAVRVALPMARSAAQVAAALRPVLGDAALVWCGDQGLDAGSGAVPAFLAAMLGCEAALGLVDVTVPAAGSSPGGLTVLRRLDGGRREQLGVGTPAVLSVEGGVARLRRAPLPSVLRAGQATIEVVAASGAMASPHVRIGLPTPYRPAPRVVPAPSGDTALDRVRALTGAGGAGGAGGTTRSAAARVASPAEAADAILEALTAWGYELPERAPR